MPWGPFYEPRLTLMSAWISNHMQSKMWDEIIYQFWTSIVQTLKFGSGWIISPHIVQFCNYLSMLWLKLIHGVPGIQGPRPTVAILLFWYKNHVIFFLVCVPEVVVPSGSVSCCMYGSWGFVSVTTVQSIMCANNLVHYGRKVVFVSLHITHLLSSLCRLIIAHMKCPWGICSQVYV